MLVTHQVNISALTGEFTQSGEVLVVRQSSDGKLRTLGSIHLAPEYWHSWILGLSRWKIASVKETPMDVPPIKNAAEHTASLQDGRTVYIDDALAGGRHRTQRFPQFDRDGGGSV